MMLSGAGRAAGADLRNVNLLDLIEFTRTMPGEDTTETGHESGAHDNRNAARPGFVIEFEQTTDLRGLIGGCDHGDALTHRPTSHLELRTGRRGNDDHGRVIADPAAMPCDRTAAKIVDKALTPFEAGIADLERVDDAAGAQLPGDPSTGRSSTEEQDPSHQRKSSPRSSRQPPVWGGTPPWPRTLIAAATAMPAPMATNARRIKVIRPPPTMPPDAVSTGSHSPSHGVWCVGLAGVEPATSPLSGVRSNQLSYSPVRPTTLAVVVAIDDPFVGATDFRIGTRLGVGWGRKVLVCCAGLRSDGRFRHNLIGG